ncbi:Fis family transcriptional regulator [Parahalioglobus pacificus]|uniref:Fis family transcriptional regulator n=1 Tax=Parahalioglobus pacificus TaxID=930806 RepID=A0A919CKW6_9GAMM|nr:Fis family transcriptional regulator [Halioglobus pacificus]NQY03475.1 Fis family transcriptional regulator [Halieaceae bacterium]GHD32080.1 hypothetical protein GCM10007053_15800 [Halioglobus pacificus]
MRKTDRKTDKRIREALTEVCDIALNEVEGFAWLTHLVNYQSFPDSLSVVCVFANKIDLLSALSSHKDHFLRSLIDEKLRGVNVPIKDLSRQVSFDSEECCQKENDGNWKERLSRSKP